MLWITGSGIGSGLKRRIERRVRKKLCRSTVVGVKVGWFNAEGDPLLSWFEVVGCSPIFEGGGVDMLICTFSCVRDYFAAYAQITIGLLRVLDGHRDFRTSLHVTVFGAAFGSIDQDILTIGVEPNGGDLWRAIGHDSPQIKKGFCVIFEKIKKFLR